MTALRPIANSFEDCANTSPFAFSLRCERSEPRRRCAMSGPFEGALRRHLRVKNGGEPLPQTPDASKG
jgi:hypothetical protein